MKNLLLLFLLITSAHAYSQCGPGYVPPSFTLNKTDETCQLNNGTLTVANLADGTAPFTFKIISPSASGVGTSNNTGIFTNLSPGQYFIQLEDACGSIRVRQTTILPYSFSFSFNITNGTCGQGQIAITTSNPGTYTYGVVTNDTTWSNTATFTFQLRTHLTVIVKDACGNIQSLPWVAAPGFMPYIEAIDHYFWCTDWNAHIVAHGFTNPTYCLYEATTHTLVNCNDSGLYVHIPYGAYYAIVSDSCYRDSFYVYNPPAYDGVQLDAMDYLCSSFTMHVDGFNTTICLYDSTTNQPFACAPAVDSLQGAVFTGVPYGTYYAYIYDPCADTTVKVYKHVSYPYQVHAISHTLCSPGQTELIVNFDFGSPAPFFISVFSNNVQVANTVTSAYSTHIPVPLTGFNYTVIAHDSCGFADTVIVAPAQFDYTKTLNVVTKCPGAQWADGSGDAHVYFTSNTTGTFPPKIISKNGVTVDISPVSTGGNNFNFIDLEPATYIVWYGFTGCSAIVLHDTFTIAPYVLPVSTPSSVYQCDSKLIAFNSNIAVTGGLAPFTYEVIGSTPSAPSINTAPQSTPDFSFNNGTDYTNVKLRMVDGCGNSAIANITVQPLGNLVVTATDTCFYHNMVLSVPSIPNAQYFWYKKINTTDSVLIGSSPVYTTYITPDSIGYFECKIVLPNNCATRIPGYNLTGVCYGTLPVDTIGGATGAFNRNNFIKVYPNPSTSYIHIQFNKKKKEDYLITIFNSLGQRVYEQKLYGIDRRDYLINKTFQRGQYFIRINDETYPHLVQ